MNFMQPGLQGLMTRRVGPQQQGQLQGANQGLQGVASVAGPMIFGLTFAWAVRHDATLHAPGLLAMALSLGGFICLGVAGWLGGKLVYVHRLGAD